MPIQLLPATAPSGGSCPSPTYCCSKPSQDPAHGRKHAGIHNLLPATVQSPPDAWCQSFRCAHSTQHSACSTSPLSTHHFSKRTPLETSSPQPTAHSTQPAAHQPFAPTTSASAGSLNPGAAISICSNASSPSITAMHEGVEEEAQASSSDGTDACTGVAEGCGRGSRRQGCRTSSRQRGAGMHRTLCGRGAGTQSLAWQTGAGMHRTSRDNSKDAGP